MKHFSIFLSLFIPLLFFTSCPGGEREEIDLGTIPEEYLATVPYGSVDWFYLQHESDRVIIPFFVTRNRIFEYGGDYDMPFKYQPASKYNIKYEVDRTVCKPDYPLFDIVITFSNYYKVYEQGIYNDGVVFHSKVANISSIPISSPIPLYGEPTEGYKIYDTLTINGITYTDVFELSKTEYDMNDIPSTNILYYNYEKGILGIKLSNGENYLRYEE